jgi:hypothetical protein
MYAFILLLCILAIAYIASPSTEGFKGHDLQMPTTPYGMKGACPTGTSIIPVTMNMADRSYDPTQVKPHSMPGELPVAAYEQIGAASPLPYQDTTLIKANEQQLKSLLEMVKGFLAFEAQELSEKSDPSIQLPLQTARSDFHVLQREVEVMNRNPGIQSTLTLMNVNEMSSNLAYLQKQVRLIGSAGSLQGPVNEFVDKSKEGFTDKSKEGFTNKSKEGFANINNNPATVAELSTFAIKVDNQIQTLAASGTNEPVTKKRISDLTGIKAYIQGIVDQINANILSPSDVLITQNDIKTAFKIISTPNSSTADALSTLGIQNITSNGSSTNPKAISNANKLVDRLTDKIIKGVTASFNVSYPANNVGPSSIDQTGFPSMCDLDNVSNAKFIPSDAGMITDPLAATPMDAGRQKASHFDWKQRAKEIEDQVKKRGLRPEDFGITGIQNPSKEFSWKGYARMICTRLQATMDPALPVTCGCPPMDWKGWRN